MKKNHERDKNENCDDIKKPERSIQAKHIDFAKGFVVTDNIRKEINSCESKLRKTWSEKYHYLTGEYFKKVLAEECAKAKITEDIVERKSSKNPIEKSPIPLESTRMPVPTTSSAMVGWRSSRSECDLEFVGPLFVSAKHTIDPPVMPWEFRVTRQKFIFLG